MLLLLLSILGARMGSRIRLSGCLLLARFRMGSTLIRKLVEKWKIIINMTAHSCSTKSLWVELNHSCSRKNKYQYNHQYNHN